MAGQGWSPATIEGERADAKAKTALRTWKRGGAPVDPANAFHVSTYLMLKAQNPSGNVRKNHLVAALEAAKSRLSQEAALTTCFWVVRTTSMAPQLPASLKSYLVPAEEMQRDYELPFGFDLDQWYVFDPSTPTTKLGMRAKQMKFTQRLSTTVTVAGSLSAPGCSSDPPLGVEDGQRQVAEGKRPLEAAGAPDEEVSSDDETAPASTPPSKAPRPAPEAAPAPPPQVSAQQWTVPTVPGVLTRPPARPLPDSLRRNRRLSLNAERRPWCRGKSDFLRNQGRFSALSERRRWRRRESGKGRPGGRVSAPRTRLVLPIVGRSHAPLQQSSRPKLVVHLSEESGEEAEQKNLKTVLGELRAAQSAGGSLRQPLLLRRPFS